MYLYIHLYLKCEKVLVLCHALVGMTHLGGVFFSGTGETMKFDLGRPVGVIHP